MDIRYYSIIYQLIDEVKAALSGMLDPERVETILGIAQVRDTFRSPKFGQVAGCMVLEGTVYRNKRIRVLRDNVVIFEGELESLRRFKDDVAEVRHGMECGIGVKNYEVKSGRSDRSVRSEGGGALALSAPAFVMAREFKRSDRVADAVQRSLAQAIPNEVRDPRLGMVNINAVVVAKDLTMAKVFHFGRRAGCRPLPSSG